MLFDFGNMGGWKLIGGGKLFPAVLLSVAISTAVALAAGFGLYSSRQSDETFTATPGLGEETVTKSESSGPASPSAGNPAGDNTFGSFERVYFDTDVTTTVEFAELTINMGDDAIVYLPVVADLDDGFEIDWSSMKITGRVTDQWGRGIPNIGVQAYAITDGWTLPSVFLTNSEGYYEILVGGPGIFKISFSPVSWLDSNYWQAEYYNGSQSAATALQVPHGASGVDAVLTLTGRLSGHVQYPELSWYPMEIIAYSADSKKFVNAASILPVSIPDYFAFDYTLPPGIYKILTMPRAAELDDSYPDFNPDWGPNWYGGDSWETAATVSIIPGQSTYLDIPVRQPANSSIYGSLSDNPFTTNYNYYYINELLLGARISLVDADDQSKIVAIQDFPFGFIFENVPAGIPYKLKCSLPNGQTFWYLDGSTAGTEDFSAASEVSIPVSIAPSVFSVPVDFKIQPRTATVAGRVTWANGNPVSSLNIYAINTGDGRFLSQDAFIANPDIDGWYSRELVPGTYDFCVMDWKSGTRYCHSNDVTLSGHDAVSNVDIILPQEADVLYFSEAATAGVPENTGNVAAAAQQTATLTTENENSAPGGSTPADNAPAGAPVADVSEETLSPLPASDETAAPLPAS